MRWSLSLVTSFFLLIYLLSSIYPSIDPSSHLSINPFIEPLNNAEIRINKKDLLLFYFSPTFFQSFSGFLNQSFSPDKAKLTALYNLVILLGKATVSVEDIWFHSHCSLPASPSHPPLRKTKTNMPSSTSVILRLFPEFMEPDGDTAWETSQTPADLWGFRR